MRRVIRERFGSHDLRFERVKFTGTAAPYFRARVPGSDGVEIELIDYDRRGTLWTTKMHLPGATLHGTAYATTPRDALRVLEITVDDVRDTLSRGGMPNGKRVP